MDAVVLLETGVMLFIDNDQAEFRARQEQGRAGTDDDTGIPRGAGPPNPPAFGLPQG